MREIQNIGGSRSITGRRNPRLILDGGQFGFAAKLQSDLFDCRRFCQVEDDLSREKSGSHFDSIAFEGEDIRVDDEVDTSVFVVLRMIRVESMVGSVLKDVMQGRRQKIDLGALISSDRRHCVQVVGGHGVGQTVAVTTITLYILLPSDQGLAQTHKCSVLAEPESLAFHAYRCYYRPILIVCPSYPISIFNSRTNPVLTRIALIFLACNQHLCTQGLFTVPEITQD